jgi:hypothetical protein
VDNVEGAVDVPLSLFGGLNSELTSTDLPQGLSPDCQDVAYLPGSVFTRPSLQRALTVPGLGQAIYHTSFVKRDGTLIQMVFDSLGNMWANGLLIGTTRAGNRFKTFDAFGRKYIAVSDGLHGADVPLQYDGTNLDRISQDGPGAAPAFAAFAIVGDTFPIVSITQPAAKSWGFSYFLQSTGPGSTAAGNVGTVYYSDASVGGADPDLVAAVAAGFPVYMYVSFTGVPVEQGPYTVLVTGIGEAMPPGQPRNFYYFTYNLPSSAYTYYAGSGHVGYSANYQRTLATLTTSVPVPGLEIRQTAGVSGTSTAAYDSNWPISQTPTSGILEITQTSLTAGVATYHYIVTGGVPPVVGQLVSVTDTLNANGMLNGTNLTIATASGGTPGTFTVNGFSALVDYPNEAEAGQGVTAGTVFAFDPGLNTVGTGSTSPIYGDSAGGELTFGGSAAVVSPGTRQGVEFFITRSGAITFPGPAVTFTVPANTNAIAVSPMAIGPANVVARGYAFTGADGGRFFYLPTAVATSVQEAITGAASTASTATVINDNVTTSAVFSFTDDALLSAVAIDIPGNNLFRQVVLGPCLGVFGYKSRLFAWGERNKIQQFWGMGFEGGYHATEPNVPLGWTVPGDGGLIVGGTYGDAWGVTGDGTGTDGMITQAAFQDQYGIAILTPLTQYTFRLWASGLGNVVAEFYSPTAGVLAKATVPIATGFVEAVFSAAMPAVIPADTLLRVYVTGLGAGQQAVLDEMEVYYTANPFLRVARASYVNNPEAFDGVTGLIGPANDTHEIRAMFERRGLLCMLTEGPEGSLYETQDTPSGEPSSWSVDPIAAQCGAISVWGDAPLENAQVWMSDTGLRIYNGGDVEKMSQEIQPNLNGLNLLAKQFTVFANDTYTRRMYLALPTSAATIPNAAYVLDYRELNTAEALSSGTPLRISYTGRMLTTDLTRKWAPWRLTVNFCGMLQLGGGQVMAFSGGTGTNLAAAGLASVYTLREGFIDGVDDDFGPFASYYAPYFMLSASEAQALQLGTHRKIYLFLTMIISGIGQVRVQPRVNRNNKPWWRTSRLAPLVLEPDNDLYVPLNVLGERVSFCVQVVPAVGGTQAGFRLSNMTVAMKDDPWSPVRTAI